MLKYILIENTDNKVRYEYFPEGKSDSGVVSYINGNFSIERLPKSDKHKIYAIKLFKRIKEMENNGSFEKNGYAAWY